MHRSHSHNTFPADKMLPLRRGKSHYHLRPDTAIQARLLKQEHPRRSHRGRRRAARQAWQVATAAGSGLALDDEEAAGC